MMLTIHLCGLVAGRFGSAYVNSKVSNNVILGFCLASGVFVFPGIFTDDLAIRYISLFLFGVMFSTTWPTLYSQVTKHMPEHKDMLAYGSNLGNIMGISLCILLSSMVADYNVTWSVFFGPTVLWIFGIIYYSSRLCRGQA
jgi:fucose permease